jgi:hypothetical protein
MRRDGAKRIAEEETKLVKKERMTMLKGRMERGAFLGSVLGRSTVGSSAMVLVRRYEERMPLRSNE